MGRIPIVKSVFAIVLALAVFSGQALEGKQSSQSELAVTDSVADEKTQNAASNLTWRFKMKLKTLGGQQFWTDLRHADGWRVQRNEVNGHHRLIDAKNYMVSSGSLEKCVTALNEAVESKLTNLHRGEVVIVLHGLMRSRRSTKTLANFLEKSNYEVINFEYASSRKAISVHADALQSVIKNLGPQVTKIHFVAHSMGNLVIRHYLRDTEKATGTQGDTRIGRFVMLGPPNQGSRMARLLKNSLLFTTLAGVSGAQLSTHWDNLEPQLATPTMEFGIIAGAQSPEKQRWSNFALEGPDDFTVSLDEAKLAGASDMLARPLLHSTMMKQSLVLKATLSFLKNGYFISEKEKAPVVRTAGN